VELYLHSPNTPSWRGAQGEHRDNFTFTFTFWIYEELTVLGKQTYDSGQGPVAASCEHSNETSCSVKGREFFDYLSGYWLLKTLLHGVIG
jgi:hypothetical protein